jgi:hypothetical protein
MVSFSFNTNWVIIQQAVNQLSFWWIDKWCLYTVSVHLNSGLIRRLVFVRSGILRERWYYFWGLCVNFLPNLMVVLKCFVFLAIVFPFLELQLLITRPLFHCRRDGLIRGDYCNTIIEYNKDSILQSKKSGNMKCINLISSMMLRVINKYIQAKQNKLNVLKRVQQYL